MPFKKGDKNINRAGRPKGYKSFKTCLIEEAGILLERHGITKIEAISKLLWQKAGEGDLKAIDMLMDRIDGKPKQSIDHTTKGDRIQSVSPHQFVSED